MKNESKEILLNSILENLHKSTLSIPVLEGYKVSDQKTGAIMVAIDKDHSVEQFLEDGPMNENESFEDRIEKVIKETQTSMIMNGLQNEELKLLGDLKTKLFHFRLYLQDNIQKDVQIRQINAYFIEPESNYFYELSLAAPPLKIYDINDFVTDNLMHLIKPILKNIRYNENNPIK